eukprot:jgi/Ulvmu1/4462/UM002_0187.1
MYGAYTYASKRDLLDWVAGLLEMTVDSLDDLISGAIWIQILDAHFQDSIPIQKVDFFAYTYEQCMANYKVLQLAFDKLQIMRDVDIQKMLEGNQGALLELLQWFFKTLGDHTPVSDYDPKRRRAVSKHGGCDRIPRFGASEAAFKRWAMKEAACEQYGMDGHHNGSRNAENRHRGPPPQPRVHGASRDYHSHLHAGQLFRKTDVSSAAEHPRKRILVGHQNGATRGSRDMSAALTVCDSASNALAERSDMLAGVARDLESGLINLCIARGCIRSLQNALITLVKHSSLLLKDIMLRLDVWNDSSASSMRRKVDDRLHKLGVQQSRLAGVLTHLRDEEMRLGPPNTSAATDTHTTISSLGEAATLLNEVLRNVDQSHAELPTLFVSGQDPTLQQLQQAQLPDVDRSTQDEIVRHEPVFLKTSTSYACKIGHFQYRKLRNGDVYKGRYSRSKKSGDGCYMFMNGDVYEGEFKDDHMEGHGVYTFSGQGRYEGAWSAARYCGHGTETFAKGSTYAGEYSAGNRCGYGVCRYYNGDFYEGTWADGVRNGVGMQQCTDGSNYVGQYKEAKREGYGVYTFHNGDCYLGTYKQDLPNGLGVYLFEKGQKYMGEWENGKKHGLCEYIVESGERYVGEWEAGKPKWVQSLGLDEDAMPELVPDMQLKVEEALKIAEKAREAADHSQQTAAEHWDAKGKAQQMLLRAVDLADDAAIKAQQARTRAMLLAHKLELVIHTYTGDAGWPQPPEDG